MALTSQNAFTPIRVRVPAPTPRPDTKQRNTPGEKEFHTMEPSHHGYYTHQKEKSAERLANLAEKSRPPETRDEVHTCLTNVIDRGPAEAIAEAIMLTSEWLHACHEIREEN